jgi:flagellar capping protein FliD
VPGLASGALSTLRDVGITLVEGGRLRLDESTLDSRLLGRLVEVRRVFEFTVTASSGGLAVYARTNALSDLDFTVAITDADGDGRAESATLDGVPAMVNGA